MRHLGSFNRKRCWFVAGDFQGPGDVERIEEGAAVGDQQTAELGRSDEKLADHVDELVLRPVQRG